MPRANHEMDEAYANAAYIPAGAEYPAIWAEKAQAFRATAKASFDVAYGEGPREVFDLFLPNEVPRGIVIFVHGGYWRAFDHRLWSHLAAGPLAQGWAVAMPGYALCPDIRISGITRQIAAAVTQIANQLPGPIVLTGHSAGGHLVARMGCGDVDLPVRNRIKRIVPISPISDLAPLMETRMNAELQIDEEEAKMESPLRHPPLVADTTIWVGAQERPAFLDQALRLGAAWGCPVLEDAGRHHFNVIESLEDANSMLTLTLTSDL